ncbi:long-chain acyl-CoA synthetase [Pseudobutyrivibrio sp. UC1225]|uniref:class I adenylate-forming enzyme family protein n=1 Tax=Pseudobutyrivibrio sp. UC1225 TaxID=1798185 RepID=UPI0008F43BAB|nr:AMP-binding protein [Pseudobutyrivibrio sp. UC1225]SFN65590.1 long-chain acyl-CoA synthetase [Pseudobutyrivibrio sp. UC1225]
MVKFLNEIKKYGSDTAFRILDGDKSFNITFEDYYKKLSSCAYNLNNLVTDLAHKKIGIYCNSSYEYTLLLTAIMFSRAVAVPLNIRESLDNLQYEIENSEVDYVVVDNDVLSGLTNIKLINKDELLKDKGGAVALTDFTEEEKEATALIVYTSGTTGRPKGVVLSVANLFGFEKAMYDDNAPFDNLEGLKVYTNFPYFHIGGINGWITHFEKGCATYLSINPGNILMDLENEQIDSAVVTPATLNLFKKSVARGHLERLGGAKLLVSAGAPVDINTVELLMKNGIGYGQYYGMSESCGNISCNFDCKNHLKSVGMADPNVKISIIDDEICAEGPGIMQGYHKNPSETAATLINGVLHTGDLGYVDEDGYIYITGRKKNLIILSGGENVSPEELEKELYKCDFITECKVYAENDRIAVDIFADESNSEAILEYIAELNTKLPIYKRIYKKNLLNQPLEKTSSGKIKR